MYCIMHRQLHHTSLLYLQSLSLNHQDTASFFQLLMLVKLVVPIMSLLTDELSPVLQIIFTQSLTTGVLPPDWLFANICPVYKKGSRVVLVITSQYH